MTHWQDKHDNLKLEQVEYVLHSYLLLRQTHDNSDDEEEDNQGEGEGADAQEEAQTESGPDPVKVKSEDDKGEGPSNRKDTREKTPSDELKIFSETHLARCDQRDLTANLQLLDGRIF